MPSSSFSATVGIRAARPARRRFASEGASSPAPPPGPASATVNVAPCPFSFGLRLHRPAVQLDQVTHDREPEAEAAVRARGRAVRLPEALEDVGQELRRDALAGVADARARRWRRRARARTPTVPPRGVNLIAFESRFQITCWSRSGSPQTAAEPSTRSRRRARRPSPPPPAARPRARPRRRRRAQIGFELEPQLAGDDARDVEDVLDELGLRPRVALDGLERPAERRRLRPRRSRSMPRPAEDGVERRAQLVRDGGEELVLGAVGDLRLLARFLLAAQQQPVRLLDPLLLVDVGAVQIHPEMRPRSSR